MTINPRADQEIKIQEAVQAGLVKNAEEIIDIGLRHLHAHPVEPRQTRTDSLVEFFRRSPLYGIELDRWFPHRSYTRAVAWDRPANSLKR